LDDFDNRIVGLEEVLKGDLNFSLTLFVCNAEIYHRRCRRAGVSNRKAAVRKVLEVPVTFLGRDQGVQILGIEDRKKTEHQKEAKNCRYEPNHDCLSVTAG